ncbi:hypothetical protein PORCAN_1104 [Porphyromonas crevioricanis JCM 13913]|nr:hypothetical protein PORCAN_1104 [Porphyromonas crevioricanis JCM 13913]
MAVSREDCIDFILVDQTLYCPHDGAGPRPTGLGRYHGPDIYQLCILHSCRLVSDTLALHPKRETGRHPCNWTVGKQRTTARSHTKIAFCHSHRVARGYSSAFLPDTMDNTNSFGLIKQVIEHCFNNLK